MPARKGPIVISLIPRIPAEYDIAKAKTLFGNGLELIKAHHLATQHPIDICYSQFYLFQFSTVLCYATLQVFLLTFPVIHVFYKT